MVLFSGILIKQQLPYEGAAINTPTPNQQNKFLAGILVCVRGFASLEIPYKITPVGFIAVMSEIEFWWGSAFPEVFRQVEAHRLEGTSGGCLIQLPAPCMSDSSRSGTFPSETASELCAMGQTYSEPLTKVTRQLQAWCFAQKSVSSEGRGPARDGRIRVGQLQGTLLCKRCKQMLAGVPPAAVPVAGVACWSRGAGPGQK